MLFLFFFFTRFLGGARQLFTLPTMQPGVWDCDESVAQGKPLLKKKPFVCLSFRAVISVEGRKWCGGIVKRAWVENCSREHKHRKTQDFFSFVG